VPIRTARSLLVSAYLQQNRMADAEELLKQALSKTVRTSKGVYSARGFICCAEIGWTRRMIFLPSFLSSPVRLKHTICCRKCTPPAGSFCCNGKNSQQPFNSIAIFAGVVDLSKHLISGRDAKGALQVITDAPTTTRNMVQTIVQRYGAALLAMKITPTCDSELGPCWRPFERPSCCCKSAMLKLTAKDIAAARIALEEVIKVRGMEVRAAGAGRNVRHAKGRRGRWRWIVNTQSSSRRHPLFRRLPAGGCSGTGNYAGARNAYMRVKQLETDPVPVELMLAEIESPEGKLEDARQRLTALVSFPSVAAAVFHELGNIKH
jgi:hypothetical protein